MNIGEKEYRRIEVFNHVQTIPDCWVVAKNKVGGGHGEGKLYIGQRNEVFSFFGGNGFAANCVMLKSDLLSYMDAIKNEYYNPSLNYNGKEKFPVLWQERVKRIKDLSELTYFRVFSQDSIAGPRGYVNSKDSIYMLIREIALPNVSFIYIEKLQCGTDELYYWKLYVDFGAIEDFADVYALKYGRNGEIVDALKDRETDSNDKNEQRERISQARKGQGKYREQLLEQCVFCPITGISYEPLLVASHIKPWAVSTDDEKIDPYNGYIFSPLYDKLFDRGYITFTEDKKLVRSPTIPNYQWDKVMKIPNGMSCPRLPMDDKRREYLRFHQSSVFQGCFNEIAETL